MRGLLLSLLSLTVCLRWVTYGGLFVTFAGGRRFANLIEASTVGRTNGRDCGRINKQLATASCRLQIMIMIINNNNINKQLATVAGYK